MGKSLEFTTQEQLGHVCDFVICDCVSEFDDGGNGIGGEVILILMTMNKAMAIISFSLLFGK